jgi:predicted N-acetyltransferase YhbS
MQNRDRALVLGYLITTITTEYMPLQIQYRENPSITPEALAELFRSAKMRRPVDDLPRLSNMIQNASLIVGAFAEDKLVGIARAITDFSYCCYLSDLAVAEKFQKQGISSELIKRVREKIGPGCNLVLVSAPQAMDYYPTQGFERIENGWIVKRVP